VSPGDRVRTIGVNLLWLIPEVVGGSEEFTIRLLRSVSDLDPADLRIELFCQPVLLEAHPDLSDRFEVRTPPVSTQAKLPRVALESTWFPLVAHSVDAVHHGGGVLPYNSPTPAVVTVHDTQPLDLPDNFGTAQRWWFSVMFPRVARRADLILCTSEFTRTSMRRHFDVPVERLRVVSHGYRPSELDPSAPVAGRVLAGFDRYLLLPGIAHPHKRHRDLIEALARLGPSLDDVGVVFTGSDGAETANLHRQVRELGLENRVRFLGRVGEHEMTTLYRGAEVMVFPSEYEGFGIPLLEAMANEVPIVTTREAAIPEVVGEAAFLVDVGRPDQLALAIGQLLGDPDLAVRLRERGRARVRAFDWSASGAALIEAYRWVLAHPRTS
jgi:alpha-1,3-rhamnosyl/mannosyltransferase